MSPIPVNASAAVIPSFFVAVIFAPWILLRLQRARPAGAPARADGGTGRRRGLYRAVAAPLLRTRRRALIFLLAVFAVALACATLFHPRDVTGKPLPFDDTSELQVMPARRRRDSPLTAPRAAGRPAPPRRRGQARA